MSQPNFEASEPTGEPISSGSFGSAPVRKQTFNIYTVMLIIAFVCLLIGTLLLFRELRQYGALLDWPWKTEAGQPKEAIITMLQHFRV